LFSPQTFNFSNIKKNISDHATDFIKKEYSNNLNSNNNYLLPIKYDFQNINYQNKNDLDYLSDDYSGLSYLNISDCETITQKNKGEKKNSDHAYRAKYKTEKCKYWEINMSCKYGDNVN
jgi:hypothetical protein